ncbi:hypothetical protein CALVIDRAFT_532102, partial [Calocera viscosa TUFC12733]
MSATTTAVAGWASAAFGLALKGIKFAWMASSLGGVIGIARGVLELMEVTHLLLAAFEKILDRLLVLKKKMGELRGGKEKKEEGEEGAGGAEEGEGREGTEGDVSNCLTSPVAAYMYRFQRASTTGAICDTQSIQASAVYSNRLRMGWGTLRRNTPDTLGQNKVVFWIAVPILTSPEVEEQR